MITQQPPTHHLPLHENIKVQIHKLILCHKIRDPLDRNAPQLPRQASIPARVHFQADVAGVGLHGGADGFDEAEMHRHHVCGGEQAEGDVAGGEAAAEAVEAEDHVGVRDVIFVGGWGEDTGFEVSGFVY